MQQVLLTEVLVDGVPQALGARFGGEGQPAPAHPLEPLHQAHGEGVGPQRGQREPDVPGGAVVQQLVAQGQQLGVVGGGQAGQGHLLIARVLTGRLSVLGQQLRAAGAHRPVGVPRLTESAPPDTAPEQLQHHPVVDNFRGGDDGFYREIGLVHVLDDPLSHGLHGAAPRLYVNRLQRAVRAVHRFIEGGHIDSLDFGRLQQELLLGPALVSGLTVEVDVLQGDLLPLPQDKEVHKGG